ncbi:unnamed protein product [Boreogadus saida]
MFAVSPGGLPESFEASRSAGLPSIRMAGYINSWGMLVERVMSLVNPRGKEDVKDQLYYSLARTLVYIFFLLFV